MTRGGSSVFKPTGLVVKHLSLFTTTFLEGVARLSLVYFFQLRQLERESEVAEPLYRTPVRL